MHIFQFIRRIYHFAHTHRHINAENTHSKKKVKRELRMILGREGTSPGSVALLTISRDATRQSPRRRR